MADERFGRSKSMDKRLAADRVALTVEEVIESFSLHCDHAARRRNQDTFTREELKELLEEALASMRDTLGHG